MKKRILTLAFVFLTVALHAQTTIAIFDFNAGQGVQQAECKAIEQVFRSGCDWSDCNVINQAYLNTTMRNLRISYASMSDDDVYKLAQKLNIQQILFGDVSMLDDGYLCIDVRVIDMNEGELFSDGQKWIRGEGFGNPILDLLRRVRGKLSQTSNDFTSADNTNIYWATVKRYEQELGWQLSERGAIDKEPEEEHVSLFETDSRNESPEKYTQDKTPQPIRTEVVPSYTTPKTDIELTEEFLENIANTTGWTKSRSGLIYRITALGNTSLKVTELSDRITVHYAGKTMRNTSLDSSYDRGEPTEFVVSNMILGWREAIKLIGVGGKISIWLHPNLAYGNRAVDDIIKANEAIYFEIELLKVNGQSDQIEITQQPQQINVPSAQSAEREEVVAEETPATTNTTSSTETTNNVATNNQSNSSTDNQANGHILDNEELRTAYENAGNICYQAADYANAFSNYINAARYGSIQAMSRLGQMYYKGMGVERNVQEAMKWWMLAVDNAQYAKYNTRSAVGFAANMIGYCYMAGQDGIPQNFELALRWFEKAAANNYAPARAQITKVKELMGNN